MNKEPLINFIHIPKAAGNTMLSVLQRQFGKKSIFTTQWGPSARMSPDRPIHIFVGERLNPENIWYPEHGKGSTPWNIGCLTT